MKNKYKVVALVPLEFSVEGNSDSKEAIESVKNIFEACRDDNDCADIVFDGIEESLRHDSIEYKVEAAQPEPEVKANSDIRSVASDICDVFENYLDENGICIVCDDADEEQDRKANESGAMLYEFELVDDNVHVRSLGQKVEELQRKMLVGQIREDMIVHPLKYIDRFAMSFDYDTLCKDVERHYIDYSYDSIKDYVIGDAGYPDAFKNGAWLLNRPDLVAEFNGEPLPEQESNPEFYKTDFWTKLASWIEANMKGVSVERRQRLYNSYISDRPIQHQLTEYGLIAPDGTWYACEFGEHAALAGRIIMRNRETFGLSDHEVLNMAYDWSGKGLDFLYKRGWIAIRNPSMGNTFLDMDETKTATKAQVNTIFDYISKFNRYDMNVSKVMAD